MYKKTHVIPFEQKIVNLFRKLKNYFLIIWELQK